MSELNQAIETWRNAQDPRVVTGELQSELEDHLHVEVSKLMGIGLPADDAVLLAAKRIGHPLAVSAELLKTDPHRIWRQRVIWMCGGYLLFMLATHLIYIATDAVGTIAYHLNLGLPSLRILMLTTFWAGYAVLILVPAWIARGRINLNRQRRTQHERFARRTGAIALALLGLAPTLWALQFVRQQNLTEPGSFFTLQYILPNALQGWASDAVLLVLVTAALLVGACFCWRSRRLAASRTGRWIRCAGVFLVASSAMLVLQNVTYALTPPGQDTHGEQWSSVVMSMQMAYWNAGLLLPAGLCMVVWSLHIRRSTARPR